MGGKYNTIYIPQRDSASSVARFRKAAAEQESSLKKGLAFYETALAESAVEMQKGYKASTGVLASLSESSNRALDETMRMMGLDPVNRGDGNYQGGYTAEERNDRLENLPGYQFQLEQGTKAIERQGAAAGMLGSGNTLHALQEYGQGQAQNYFQGYLQNLNNITESGKAATFAIADNKTAASEIESQKQIMLGNARRETELSIGTVRADEQYRSAASEESATDANNNNAYRYFATVSDKAAQNYATNSTNSRAADKLDFAREQFNYKRNQGVDAYNQSQGGTSDRVGSWSY